jgi:hypothetical protein
MQRIGRASTSHLIVTAVFLLVLLPVLTPNSIAQSAISIETDKASYSAGQTVSVSGSIQSTSSVPVAIEIRDGEGKTILLRTIQSDENGRFSLDFKVPQSSNSGKLSIYATSSDSNGGVQSGTRTVVLSQSSPPNTNSSAQEQSGNPSQPTSQCIIATAAFGSEIAPQVQLLRNFRDDHILSTASGTSFMNVFNMWYYSFSPNVAEYERGQPWLQQVVRAGIYPLLGILQVSQHAYSSVPGELGALIAGATASSLIGAVYFSPLALLSKKIRAGRLGVKIGLIVVSAVSIVLVTAIVTSNPLALMISSAAFVVAILATSAMAVAVCAGKVGSSTIFKQVKKESQ